MSYLNLFHSFWEYLCSGNQLLAMRANLWRLAEVEDESCDVALILRDSDEFLRRKQIAVWIVKQLKTFAPHLQIDVHFHRINNSYALYISASHIGYLKGAELCRLKKRVKSRFGGALRDFIFDEAHIFEGTDEVRSRREFFTSAERAIIVRRLIEMIRASKGGLVMQDGKHRETPTIFIPEGKTLAILVATLTALGIIRSIFPLHDPHELERLRRDWVMASAPLRRQPLADIRRYFGDEIALYFAWLEHYTMALGIPAVLGILSFFFGDFKFDNSLVGTQTVWSDLWFVAFSLTNCIWAMTYMELWKRRQAELAFQWKNVEKSLIDDPRPEFKSDRMTRNIRSGEPESQYASWKHVLIRYGITYPCTLACIVVVFLFLFAMLRLQEVMNSYFASDSSLARIVIHLPMITQAVIILLADNFYRYLALQFNDLENYRTDEEFESFLITKIVIFQCVNAFGSLVYIAFYLNDLRRLQETLATLLISRQFLQNLVELMSPLLKEKIRIAQHSYSRFARSYRSDTLKRSCTVYRNSSLRTSNKTKSPSSMDYEDSVLKDGLRQRQSSINTKTNPQTSERLPIPEFRPAASEKELNDVELQSLMTDYVRPLDDYLEIFIQFGYITLFAPAWTHLNFAIQCSDLLRGASKILVLGRAQSEFIWPSKSERHIIFELMCIAGVMVNCALIAQCGVLSRLLPDMDVVARVLLVVGVEHAIFALRFVIDTAISDVPPDNLIVNFNKKRASCDRDLFSVVQADS